MLFRTHLSIALFVFLICFHFFENPWIFGLFFLFATLFVDIDSSKSRFGKNILFRPIQIFFSHRGAIHSLFVALFFSSLIFVFDFSAGFGFLIGYLLHLFLDCFTLSGVCLFWPLSEKKIKGFIRTGNVLEEVLFVVFLLLDIYLLVKFVFNILSSTI